MRTEIIKIADELDAAVEKSEAADRDAFVYPLRIAMREASKRLRASLQEEERVTPIEKVEAESYRQALSLIFDELGLERGKRTRPDATLRIKALKRSAAPPSEEAPQAHPQTLEYEGIAYVLKRVGEPNFTNVDVEVDIGDLLVFPTGEQRVLRKCHVTDQSVDWCLGAIYTGAAHYKPSPVPPQEPPTPQMWVARCPSCNAVRGFFTADDGRDAMLDFLEPERHSLVVGLESQPVEPWGISCRCTKAQRRAAAPAKEVRG